jgi:hypothetical protein
MKSEWSVLLLSLTLASPVLAADVSYRNDIAPMIKAQCSECHGAEAPPLALFKTDEEKYKKDKTGPRIDSYADLTTLIVWPDTGAFMRRLDDGSSTPDKKPGNMYKYLGETEAERQASLAIYKAWLGDDAWNLNRWAKRGEVPAITKDQLDKLKLKY